jgi:hypothetical protein
VGLASALAVGLLRSVGLPRRSVTVVWRRKKDCLFMSAMSLAMMHEVGRNNVGAVGAKFGLGHRRAGRWPSEAVRFDVRLLRFFVRVGNAIHSMQYMM